MIVLPCVILARCLVILQTYLLEYQCKNINKISEYAFNRLRKLLSKEKKSNKNKILDLSIGQPYHKFPPFVKNILVKENPKWSLYPPIKGLPILRSEYLKWLKRRFNLKSTFFGDENIDKGLNKLINDTDCSTKSWYDVVGYSQCLILKNYN